MASAAASAPALPAVTPCFCELWRDTVCYSSSPWYPLRFLRTARATAAGLAGAARLVASSMPPPPPLPASGGSAAAGTCSPVASAAAAVGPAAPSAGSPLAMLLPGGPTAAEEAELVATAATARANAARDGGAAITALYNRRPQLVHDDMFAALLEPVEPEALAAWLPADWLAWEQLWYKLRPRADWAAFPALRSYLASRHAGLAHEGVDVEDMLDTVGCGGESGRAHIVPCSTIPGHILSGERHAAACYTATAVRAGQVMGAYSGVLVPTSSVHRHLGRLSVEEHKRVWTYDYEAPRLGSAGITGQYSFYGASVRSAMCALNDYHGIRPEGKNVRKCAVILGGLIPLVLFVAAEDMPANTEALVEYGNEWYRTYCKYHPSAKGIFFGQKARENDPYLGFIVKAAEYGRAMTRSAIKGGDDTASATSSPKARAEAPAKRQYRRKASALAGAAAAPADGAARGMAAVTADSETDGAASSVDGEAATLRASPSISTASDPALLPSSVPLLATTGSGDAAVGGSAVASALQSTDAAHAASGGGGDVPAPTDDVAMAGTEPVVTAAIASEDARLDPPPQAAMAIAVDSAATTRPPAPASSSASVKDGGDGDGDEYEDLDGEGPPILAAAAAEAARLIAAGKHLLVGASGALSDRQWLLELYGGGGGSDGGSSAPSATSGTDIAAAAAGGGSGTIDVPLHGGSGGLASASGAAAAAVAIADVVGGGSSGTGVPLGFRSGGTHAFHCDDTRHAMWLRSLRLQLEGAITAASTASADGHAVRAAPVRRRRKRQAAVALTDGGDGGGSGSAGDDAGARGGRDEKEEEKSDWKLSEGGNGIYGTGRWLYVDAEALQNKYAAQWGTVPLGDLLQQWSQGRPKRSRAGAGASSSTASAAASSGGSSRLKPVKLATLAQVDPEVVKAAQLAAVATTAPASAAAAAPASAGVKRKRGRPPTVKPAAVEVGAAAEGAEGVASAPAAKRARALGEGDHAAANGHGEVAAGAASGAPGPSDHVAMGSSGSGSGGGSGGGSSGDGGGDGVV